MSENVARLTPEVDTVSGKAVVLGAIIGVAATTAAALTNAAPVIRNGRV